MTLQELKDWINSLPEEFSEYSVVNGEEGKVDDQYWYRLDKPVVTLMANEEGKEIIILNEYDGKLTDEELNKMSTDE